MLYRLNAERFVHLGRILLDTYLEASELAREERLERAKLRAGARILHQDRVVEAELRPLAPARLHE